MLKVAANDPDRLAEHAESILERQADLEQYLQPSSRDVDGMPRIAYFCAEFAIAESLPIYSGGLGVLAGDHLKAASDLGLPLVGVGLLYRYGYFRQVIDETGYQREAYDRLDTDAVAVRPVLERAGRAGRDRGAVPRPHRAGPGLASPRSGGCRCICSTPIWPKTARTTAGSPATCTAATRTPAFARRSCSASAACGRCARCCRPTRSPTSCT